MSEQISYVGETTTGDEFLDVRFYTKIIDGVEVEFVNVKVPGDKTLEIDVPVEDTHKRRFGRKYDAFKSMQMMSGTPVEEWDDIPQAFMRELKYLGFNFVEQLAGAPDSAFARVMGGVQWRVKAQNFLNRGKIPADDVIKKQQAEIDEMKAQIAALLAQNGDAPKRGRKAKVVEDEPSIDSDES